MIYDEQLRVPFTVSYPAKYAAAAGTRKPGIGRGRRHRPHGASPCRRPDRNVRYPWLRGKSVVPALEDPAGARGKDFTVSTCDEVWSPQEYAGVGPAWKRHVRAALSGHFKVARYVAMTGDPLKEHTSEQEYELYDLGGGTI